jgi:hypothetical protein
MLAIEEDIMGHAQDPTESLRKRAASFPDVIEGASCNQTSFKTSKASFLFVGPGAKGIGFKAMFKLSESLGQASDLAAREPDRFEAGSSGWVTARFTSEKPLPESIWEPWLTESHDLACKSGAKTRKKPVRKKAPGKR